jgi:hypothetical protein
VKPESKSIMVKPTLLDSLVATAALLGTCAAIAQEATPAPEIDNFVSTKTRAVVIAETQDAAHRGLIARNDADADRIAAMGYRSVLPRAQVRAETAVAVRLGLTRYGDGAAPQATPAQLEQIRAAGLRALQADHTVAVK